MFVFLFKFIYSLIFHFSSKIILIYSIKAILRFIIQTKNFLKKFDKNDILFWGKCLIIKLFYGIWKCWSLVLGEHIIEIRPALLNILKIFRNLDLCRVLGTQMHCICKLCNWIQEKSYKSGLKNWNQIWYEFIIMSFWESHVYMKKIEFLTYRRYKKVE